MRKNLAKHTAKKLPLAKRVLALCFALIFVCSCLLPAFANGTGEGLDTPDTEVVEAADPGTEPEPMDLYDEPAALDDDFAVADEPAALDDDFAMDDEPAAMDDSFGMGDEAAAQGDEVEKPVVDDEPAAMDDQVEKPVVDDEPAAMDNEVEKPVEGGEPPVADDTPAKEGATKTTTDASGNTVYEYDTSGTTFPDDDAAALPDGDQMQVDAAFSIPTNIYHFWLKKMSSYDLADIAADAETAEMTVEQYLAMYGTDKGCYHIMTAADGANLKDYQFADPTSNDDPEGNSRTFAGWYYTDELGDEQKFVFDEFLYISEGTTVEVYAKWTDEEDEEAEETKKDDPAAAQKAKFKQWYQNLVDCTSEYTLKSLAEEYFATEGFYTYLGSLPDEEQEVLWDKLEPINQPKDDTAEYEEETQDDGIALLSITATVKTIHIGKKLVLKSSLTDYDADIGWNKRHYTAVHSWESRDSTIATVESGTLYQTEKATVTGVKVGTTTITHKVDWYTYDYYGNATYYRSDRDTFTVEVVKDNQKIDDSDTPVRAGIFILKTPTSDPKSNAQNQWAPDNSAMKWIGEVNTYGAEWTGNKNVFSYPAQYVTQWPDETKLPYWLLTSPGTTVNDHNYFEEVRDEIFSYYKSSIEDELKKKYPNLTNINLTKDDITQIKITPFKISKNNDSDPDKHIDCTIDIVNNKVYTAKFWVMGPEATQYTQVDSATYLKESLVSETTQATIGDTKTVNGTTYVLKGWYKENSDYMGTPDEAGAATDQLISESEWAYAPSTGELADGTVHFYARYEPVNTDFTVKKEVTGWFGDKTKQFNFVIDSGTYEVTVTQNGISEKKQSFTLSDGETVTISGIPANVLFTVKETLDDVGYKTTASGYKTAQNTAERTFRYMFVRQDDKFVLQAVDGEVDAVKNSTIVVTNEREGEIDNGVLLDTLPYILILVVVAGGGVLLFLRKRKNDDDE